MKKIAFVLVLIAVLAVPSAFAQLRLDMGFDIPVRIGLSFNNFSDTESVNILEEYIFLLPEAMFAYQFNLGQVNLGVGLRLYTLILESIAWPMGYAELDFDRVAITASVGGGLYLLFGLYNEAGTGEVIIPELFAGLKLGKARNFKVGAGAMAFLGPELSTDVVPYYFYLGAKWSVLFD